MKRERVDLGILESLDSLASTKESLWRFIEVATHGTWGVLRKFQLVSQPILGMVAVARGLIGENRGEVSRTRYESTLQHLRECRLLVHPS